LTPGSPRAIDTLNNSYSAQVREILATHGRLPVDVAQLSDDSDLYDAGLTSLITVNLMLAIEDHFDVEFPDEMLSRRTFQSINSLALAVGNLLE
jgi:acyl carrier protein